MISTLPQLRFTELGTCLHGLGANRCPWVSSDQDVKNVSWKSGGHPVLRQLQCPVFKAAARQQR